MILKHSIIIILFFFTASSFSQKIITGKIKDSSGNAVINANVFYKLIKSNRILGYQITDKTGEFKLEVASALDSIVLNISHISFNTLVENIDTDKYKSIFILKKRVDNLEEIVIKSPPPIYKERDTINYTVSSFKDNTDKVIKDIIKKLPGIEIDGDRILYNNRPIQKFYINGLDMLEGKYNLANENLPTAAVKSVQIIENDQPIKILDSLVFSDRASLNLELNNDITVTGTANAEIGGFPLNWDVNITPMLFKKNIQNISSYQSNNIGKSIKNQLRDLTSENHINEEDKEFLNLIEVVAPPIDATRWIFNNVNFINTNFLKKLKTGLEIKGGLSYLNNNNSQSSSSTSKIFTKEEEIILTEQINNFRNLNSLKGNFTLYNNKEKLYFENKLSFENEIKQGRGSITANNSNILQTKKNKKLNIQNILDLKTFIRSKLIQINSSSHIISSPQTLKISFPDNATALQSIEYFDWQTKNAASFIERFANFTLIPEIGFLFAKKTLDSHLRENMENEAREDKNKVSKFSAIPFLSLKTQYNSHKVNVALELPFRITSIMLLEDNILEDEVNRLLFFPELQLRYELNSKWNFRTGTSFNQIFSEIDQLYSSPILMNYRSLQQFDSKLRITKIWDSYFSTSFKNPLKGMFIDFSLSYSKKFKDYTPSYNINENGFYRFNLSNLSSHQSSLHFSSNLSKFFRKSKTIIKLKNFVGLNSSQEILDNEKNNIDNHTYSAGIELNNNKLDWLVVDYANRFLFSKKFINAGERISYNLQEHNLDVSTIPLENHIISFNQNYTINKFQNRTSSYFADAVYQIQIPKWDIELELTMQNIFNEKDYISIINTDFSIVENIIQLRPRQFLIGLDFNF